MNFIIKKQKNIFQIITVLLMIVTLTACAGLKGTEENTHVNGGYQDTELMEKIANDYADHMSNNSFIKGEMWVDYCYGVYDDCVPVMMAVSGSSTSEAERDVEIGDVIIHYRNGDSIEVWNDGDFYSLEEAYVQGLLTDENLQEIADIHNNVRYSKTE